MADGREYVPNTCGETYRMMTRCMTCTRWWSIPENWPQEWPHVDWHAPPELIGADHEAMGTVWAPLCPCGGLLTKVDMAKHIASLPRAK